LRFGLPSARPLERHFGGWTDFFSAACPHAAGGSAAQPHILHDQETKAQTIFNLQSSIFNLQSSIFNLQSSIFNLQSSIFNLPKFPKKKIARRRFAVILPTRLPKNGAAELNNH